LAVYCFPAGGTAALLAVRADCDAVQDRHLVAAAEKVARAREVASPYHDASMDVDAARAMRLVQMALSMQRGHGEQQAG